MLSAAVMLVVTQVTTWSLAVVEGATAAWCDGFARALGARCPCEYVSPYASVALWEGVPDTGGRQGARAWLLWGSALLLTTSL